MKPKIKPIAIYLPQFHPVPENNEWWGEGFTEWRNVTSSKPLFKDHYQPHLPKDNGFYDLRLHQTMIDQAEMAKKFGIQGFMFYHYWFSGKRILETPVNQWLNKKSPDFPFCLCWANENWTRRWDGMDQNVLLKQTYSKEDDILHFKELLRHFVDERYICVDGKPVFAIYRTNLFPNILETAKTWRNEAIKAGLKGLYLVSVESFNNKLDPRTFGFDASIEFQPDFQFLPKREKGSLFERILNKLNLKKSVYSIHTIYDYQKLVKKMESKPDVSYKQFLGITPMWDNSARRKSGAIIFKNSSPESYKKWLLNVLSKSRNFSTDENFIFINAWNEWAEGNHLEPCLKWGQEYLEATKDALIQTNNF